MPVTCHSCAASNCITTTWHGRQTIPTIFPTFFFRPTLSNSPTRVLNTPCSHPGSDNAHSVILVEEGILVSALMSLPALPTHALYHHLDLVPHHHIHHHIEYVGGGRFPLCHPPEAL